MAIVLGAIVLKCQAERARPRAPGSPCNITLPILKKGENEFKQLAQVLRAIMIKNSGFYPKTLF